MASKEDRERISREKTYVLAPWYGKGGGGGGDVGVEAVLPYGITATTTVGGVSTGKHYNEGTHHSDIIKDILCPNNYPTLTPPSATITGTGDKLLEKGSTVNATITIILNRGKIDPAYGTSGYRSGAATGYSLNGGTQQIGNQFSVTVSESNNTFSGRAYYAQGEQPKDSAGNNYESPLPAGSVATSQLEYEFVHAFYATTDSITEVSKLPIASSKDKTYIFEGIHAQTDDDYMKYDVPKELNNVVLKIWNPITQVWQVPGNPYEFAASDVTHQDAAGRDVAYTRYTDNRGYAAAGRRVKIEWT